ncbi:osmotically-inducible lipoprotein OsmE, partial [Pseudomonas syringae group genomosp. 7]|uniref:osmotically-inducible lipoprotein OsmE n=1 Tax=Pseudomonas syringae group genomosp. 7 TaxID=251699 RepID=UPI0037706E97
NTTVEKPVVYVTYRNVPFVIQVEHGMTRQHVLTIGGEPSSTIERKVNPGTCNNYVMNKDGHKQVYQVSFNSDGRVTNKG